MSRLVLVIDDEASIRQSLNGALKDEGYRVATATSGREGIEALRSERPDVVLLDIGMPKLDGYEAARSIRQQSWGRDMMLVALTGWGQAEDKRRSHEAGFDAHLVKPVDFDALETLVAGIKDRNSSNFS